MDSLITPEAAFPLLHVPVFAAWALLIVAPRWQWTWRIVHEAWIPLALAVVYSVMLVWGLIFGGAPEGSGFSSLHGVMTLFTMPAAMLNGWIHYLAFDLFIGAWIARDALRHGIGHLPTIPCLLLTFIYGPTGLFCYFVVRWFAGSRTFSMDEQTDPGARSAT